MKPKSIFLVLCFIVTFSLLTACNGNQPSTPEPSGTPLRFGWSLWPGWYPLLLADANGLFEKHGVEVEIIQYDYATSIAEFNSGTLDGALFGILDALPAARDSKVVYITDNSNGAEGIVASPDISTPADLKGKQVGILFGGTSEIFASVMLENFGLTRTDVTFISVNPEEVPSSIPSRVSAGHTWEPYVSEALAQGNHLLYSSADTPGLIPDVLVFRTSVVDQRPDEIKAFIAAWVEAVQYWQTNPTEANAILTERLGLTVEEISTEGVRIFTLEDNRNAFTPGDDFSSLYFSAQYNLDFLIRSGSLTYQVDVNQFLDPSFLP